MVGSGDDSQVAAATGIDPQEFTTEVDNPFFPLPVGAHGQPAWTAPDPGS